MKLAAPKWDRLDPLPKLKQMFMLQEMGVDIVLQLMRVAVVLAVAYISIKNTFPRLMQMQRVGLEAAALEIARAVFRLGLWSEPRARRPRLARLHQVLPQARGVHPHEPTGAQG
jgi:flagellar biosynthesis protein FlhB